MRRRGMALMLKYTRGTHSFTMRFLMLSFNSHLPARFLARRPSLASLASISAPPFRSQHPSPFAARLQIQVETITKELDDIRLRHIESAPRILAERRATAVRELSRRLMDMGRGELGGMNQGGAAVGGMDGGDMGHVGRALHDGVLDVIQRFGSNSKDRRILVDYHFAQIESALLPPYAKFLLWMMCMGKSFFRGKGSAVRASKKGGADGDDGDDNENDIDDGAGGSEGGAGGVGGAGQGATLWALLSNELGLTFDQVGFLLWRFTPRFLCLVRPSPLPSILPSIPLRCFSPVPS